MLSVALNAKIRTKLNTEEVNMKLRLEPSEIRFVRNDRHNAR